MQANDAARKNLAEMIAAVGFDEIDPKIQAILDGVDQPDDIDLNDFRVASDRYVVPEIECLPVMVSGRIHAYQPSGRWHRRPAHLEECLAYMAHCEAEIPDGYTIISSRVEGDTHENIDLAVWRQGSRKTLCLAVDLLYERQRHILCDVDDPDHGSYGQDEDVLMDDTVACFTLVVPVEDCR